ncbi:hypothetical protein COOONC_12866 [Cooperia oncophora]
MCHRSSYSPGIGIDDLFVMSAEWHRTNPDHSPARRIADTLSEAAVAITITSVTDIMTFGIGIFTTLPGVRMFCLYTCLQVTFTYIYQLARFFSTCFSSIRLAGHDGKSMGTRSVSGYFRKALNRTHRVRRHAIHDSAE